MKETTGTVQKGTIKVHPSVHLPEGATVRILWEDEPTPKPLEREALTDDDVTADIRWATGKQFQ